MFHPPWFGRSGVRRRPGAAPSRVEGHRRPVAVRASGWGDQAGGGGSGGGVGCNLLKIRRERAPLTPGLL